MRKISFRMYVGLPAVAFVIVITVTVFGNYSSLNSSHKGTLKASDDFEKYREALLKDNLIKNKNTIGYGNEENSLAIDANLLKQKTGVNSGVRDNYNFRDWKDVQDDRLHSDRINDLTQFKDIDNGHVVLSKGNPAYNNGKTYKTNLQNERSGKYNSKQIVKDENNSKEKMKENDFSNWLQTLMDDGVVRDCITGNELYSYSKRLKKQQRPLKLGDRKNSFFKEDLDSRKESFVDVYDSRAWGHSWDPQYKDVNASGRGATLDWTQEVIASLHLTINAVKKKFNKTNVSLLDIPCGDFAWMNRFLKTRNDIEYTGMDIVPGLIAHHRKVYKPWPKWKFINADALSDTVSIGQYDIILCRMMLQHLYDYDVLRLLEKFSQSGSTYIFLTTFTCHKKNQQLLIDNDNPGRFRPINLQIDPVSLRPPLCTFRDGAPDVIKPWEHYMGLWPLPLTRVEDCELRKFKTNVVPCELHACY